MNPIQIIGIGQGIKDMTQAHLDQVYNCDILVGGRRMLAMFEDAPAQTIAIKSHVEELVMSLERQAEKKKIVVLASGDPLFHGIGSTFCRLLPKDKFDIHSNISSASAAFAAIKLPWHDARLISLHGMEADTFAFNSLACEDKIAFLTDPVRTPQYIAEQLTRAGLSAYKSCVLENIGDPFKQKITWFESIEDMIGNTFGQPNVLICLKTGSVDHSSVEPFHIGMDDTRFRHSKGLITKSEVRAVSLSKLRLTRKDLVLWDIGSGSGSVGIEASFMIPDGQVIAIEKNKARVEDIIFNAENFNCPNIKAIHCDYPEGVETIEKPDRIFIGGGGAGLADVIAHAAERLSDRGVIVVNTVLLQNLETAVTALEKHNFTPDVIQIQVSRGKSMPFGTRFEALNPVWIISGTKNIEKDKSYAE